MRHKIIMTYTLFMMQKVLNFIIVKHCFMNIIDLLIDSLELLFSCISRKEISLKLLRKSISTESKQSLLYCNTGKVLYSMRYFSKSEMALTKAISLGDKSRSSYDKLIDALEANGNHAEALKFILEKEHKYKSGLPYTRSYPIMRKYTVGKFTYGIPITKDWHHGSTLNIGDFCSIVENVDILLGGNHSIDWISSYPFGVIFDEVKAKSYLYPTKSKGAVVVGNDVWLGMNVTILSGVTIGDGAVVAACSMVTRNVEPYTIAGGNPANSLKKRFQEKEIAKLLETQWWNWDISKIEANIQLISSNDIAGFIAQHNLSKPLPSYD
jgi:acetyltransferase-like isoleucine patch superfamily enzyme